MVGVASFGRKNMKMTGLSVENSCNALLQNLQCIWTEIGVNDAEKDRMLLELEAEIMQIYRRKVDEATNDKARLKQTVTAKEAELAALIASLGEHTLHSKMAEKGSTSLIDQFARVTPLLDELRPRKEERARRISEIRSQIETITGELSGADNDHNLKVSGLLSEEHDLSLRKLNEYQTQLQALRKEKSDRVDKVLEYVNQVHCLCRVLGVDELHPSLQNTDSGQSIDISNSRMDGLARAVVKLETEKMTRFQKLRDTMASLWELWKVMDSSEAERRRLGRVMFIVGTPENDIIDRGSLSLDVLEQTKTEFERLSNLKASRIKELVFRKRRELEEICKAVHIRPESSTDLEKADAMIDSGIVDPTEILANIDGQILKAKEQVMERKDIIDRVRKWVAACEEEEWLQEYNNDPRRYSVARGAHLNLRRAERARITITKIPGVVANLMNRVLDWEDERNASFMYDGVRLMSILKEYQLTQQQRDEEKTRCRGNKKLHQQLLQTIASEKESIYGSKQLHRKISNGLNRKPNGTVPPTPRRVSGATTPTHSRMPGAMTP